MTIAVLIDSINFFVDTALIIELLLLAAISFLFRSKDKKLH